MAPCNHKLSIVVSDTAISSRSLCSHRHVATRKIPRGFFNSESFMTGNTLVLSLFNCCGNFSENNVLPWGVSSFSAKMVPFQSRIFLTVAKWVYQIVQVHIGLTHHFLNFWHSGCLTLSPERQRARMSKIKKWWVRPVWPWTLWGVTIWHHWDLKG